MTDVAHEGAHTGQFLVSEANGARSRETITLAEGQDLEAGTVLGKVTATGKYAQVAPTATDGTESAAGILFDNVDASAADSKAVAIARDAEVRGSDLVWPEGVTAEQREAAVGELLAAGIVIR